MKKNYVTIRTPAGHPMYTKYSPVYNALHRVLNAEHMGEAKGHVKDLRQFIMGSVTTYPPRPPLDNATQCLMAIWSAVNNAETQTLEELHACLRGTLALIDITVED